MSIKMSQDLKQTQGLMMTPQLRQAISLLTVPHLEMTQVISKELMENPLLEEIGGEIIKSELVQSNDYQLENLEMQTKEDHSFTNSTMEKEELLKYGSDGDVDSGKNFEDGSFTSTNSLENIYLDSSERNGPKSLVGASDVEEMPSYENLVSKEETLAEHLLWQLQMDYLSEEEWEIAFMIIHNINDDGYLDLEKNEIFSKSKLSEDTIENLFWKIKHLDPIGCGSSSLKECLLVQANLCEDNNSFIEYIILNHLERLEDKNLFSILKKEIEKASQPSSNFHLSKLLKERKTISKEDLEEAINFIKELNPKPGRLITPSETHYVAPDIYVSFIGKEIVVSLNEEGIPKLRVSSLYKSMLESSSQGKNSNPKSNPELDTAKEYVKEKVRSALWLIKSIQNRQKTILKVGEAIVKLQPEFFYKGPNYLKPMILKDIASEIGMHESTVSRVTVNKYMFTPLGTFELKYFFNSGIGGKDGGTDVASETLKTKIKSLIINEDPRRPLSDQRIVEILEKEDINVARRTVAKYRENLGLAPSSKRKR